MSTPAQPAKPVSLPPEAAPTPAAPKPVEAKPQDLDAALAAALGTDVDKPTPIDPDQATADLTTLLGGEPPNQYTSREHSFLFDPQRYHTDENYRRGRIKAYLDLDPLRTGQRKFELITQLRGTSKKSGDEFEAEVEGMLIKESELEALNSWQVWDNINLGKEALHQLQDHQRCRALLAGKAQGDPIQFPRDPVQEKILPEYGALDKQWATSDGRKKLIEQAKQGGNLETYVNSKLAEEKWGLLPAAKQRELANLAANSCLDRIGALGDSLLYDHRSIGVVLLTVSNRLETKHIKIIQTLPNGNSLLRRISELRQQGGEVRLSDDEFAPYHTVLLERGGGIKSLENKAYESPQVQFEDFRKGPEILVEQMMGMKPLESKPQRSSWL